MFSNFLFSLSSYCPVNSIFKSIFYDLSSRHFSRLWRSSSYFEAGRKEALEHIQELELVDRTAAVPSVPCRVLVTISDTGQLLIAFVPGFTAAQNNLVPINFIFYLTNFKNRLVVYFSKYIRNS